jgi:hypothetical protein
VLSVSRKCDHDITLNNPPLTILPGDNEFADDFMADEIGFVSDCPGVTIPGGNACGGPVDTLVDMVECVDCVIEFGVDCVTRALVPNFEPFPLECNPPPATVTPTPTPTLSPTPTLTPLVTATGPTPTFTPTPIPTAVPCGDADIYQCYGTCPTGKVCVSIDLVCQCDDAAGYSSCATTSFGAPICWGNCPPATPICRDAGGTCSCSPF